MTGYTQYEVQYKSKSSILIMIIIIIIKGDRDALSLAELWLVSKEHRDIVYQHRMTGRPPYQVFYPRNFIVDISFK